MGNWVGSARHLLLLHHQVLGWPESEVTCDVWSSKMSVSGHVFDINCTDPLRTSVLVSANKLLLAMLPGKIVAILSSAGARLL